LEKLLTADEVAEMSNLELQAVYRYARGGAIPSIRIGRALRFPESALKKWIDDQLRNAQKNAQDQTHSLATVI
jgi:excisionase family DNA binding protein